MAAKQEIYALRKLKKRPATPEELETTQAFYRRGEGSRAGVGVGGIRVATGTWSVSA